MLECHAVGAAVCHANASDIRFDTLCILTNAVIQSTHQQTNQTKQKHTFHMIDYITITCHMYLDVPFQIVFELCGRTQLERGQSL